MEEYQQRVVDELKQLQERRGKLGEFMRTDKFKGLSREEQNLLVEQSTLMLKLEGVLESRILLFPSEKVVGQPEA